jgi:hypothetical protein
MDAILDKNPEQLTDGELRKLVEAQGRIEDPHGYTNNPGGILYGSGPLKDHQIGSVGANADSSVRIAKYDTPENGILAAMQNWKNSRYAGKSVRSSLGTWSGGDGSNYARMLGSARPGYEGNAAIQPGDEGAARAEVMANLTDFARAAGKGIGKIVYPTGIGKDAKLYNTGEAKMNDVAKTIKEDKIAVQKQLMTGKQAQQDKQSGAARQAQSQFNSVLAATNGVIEVIDPNYKLPAGSIITTYLTSFDLGKAA